MTNRVAGKKLGRTKNQRTALFRSLANSLILHEKIVTTSAKAKAVRPMVEKLITKAKSDTIHNRRLINKELASENTTSKMLEVIGPKFRSRNGGYTKMVKVGARLGDRAEMVALMFVEEVSAVTNQKEEKAKTVKVVTEKKTARKTKVIKDENTKKKVTKVK